MRKTSIYKKDGTMDMRGAKITHGLTNHPLYIIWGGIKRRCFKPRDRAYKWYGAKGIIMCNEWKDDFMPFYNWAIENGYQKGLSIERNDNTEGYYPDNCKWIKREEQQKNRTSFNRYITYNGETRILSDWCREFKAEYMLVFQRLTLGWDFERAVSSPSSRKDKP